MRKGWFLASLSTGFILSSGAEDPAPEHGSEACCGGNCRVDINSPAPGCTDNHTVRHEPGTYTGQTIQHAGFDVTQAGAMPLETIQQEGYMHMFNTSCMSGFRNASSSLSVSTVVFECAELCSPEEYGQVLFNACCTECATHQPSAPSSQHLDGIFISSQHLAFTHCKGCPAEDGQSITDAAFQSHVVAAVRERLNALVDNLGQLSTRFGDATYGSAHDGAWHTDLAVSGHDALHGVADRLSDGDSVDDRPLATTASPPTNLLHPAAGVSGVPLLHAGADVIPGSTSTSHLLAHENTTLSHDIPVMEAPTQRRLQQMFDNSFGYSTRCAAALPTPCNGTFQLKLVDCNECQDVPVLRRACCRDCGCAMGRASAVERGSNDHVHLQCLGCGCSDVAHNVERWVAAYVDGCAPLTGTAVTSAAVTSTSASPLDAAVYARYTVHGQIPLSFANVAEILTNPNAHIAIAAAIAEIAQVPHASDVTVSLQAARRLSQHRKLSGVVDAVYEISALSAALAHLAEVNVEAETTDSATAIIDRHLSGYQIATVHSIGDFGEVSTGALSLAAPAAASAAHARQSAALQASPSPATTATSPATTATSGTWLPAVAGILIALGLAVFAVVVFVNSEQARARKANAQRGLSLSPRPDPEPTRLKVCQTTSKMLPMTNLRSVGPSPHSSFSQPGSTLQLPQAYPTTTRPVMQVVAQHPR